MYINALAAAAATFACWIGSAQAIPLLTNGGFDTGDCTGWAGCDGHTLVEPSGGGRGYPSQAGGFHLQFGEIGADQLLSQSFSGAGASAFNVSFWVAGNGTSPSDLDFYWNGILQFTLTPVPSQAYTQYSFLLGGSPISDTIGFGLRNDPDWDALDTVSVTTAAAAGVPEPASLALFGSGLLGLVLARRRKRKSA
jgi:hypothetical protein